EVHGHRMGCGLHQLAELCGRDDPALSARRRGLRTVLVPVGETGDGLLDGAEVDLAHLVPAGADAETGLGHEPPHAPLLRAGTGADGRLGELADRHRAGEPGEGLRGDPATVECPPLLAEPGGELGHGHLGDRLSGRYPGALLGGAELDAGGVEALHRDIGDVGDLRERAEGPIGGPCRERAQADRLGAVLALVLGAAGRRAAKCARDCRSSKGRTSQRWREDASCFWPSLVVTTKTSSSMSSDRDSMVRTEPSAPSKTWSPGTRSPRSAQPSGNRSEIGTGMRAVSGWALPDPLEPSTSKWGESSMSKKTCSPSALTPKAMFVLGRSSHGRSE